MSFRPHAWVPAVLTGVLAFVPFQVATSQYHVDILNGGVSGWEQDWTKYVHADGDTLKVELDRDRGPSASVEGWKLAAVTPYSASFRMGGELMADSGAQRPNDSPATNMGNVGSSTLYARTNALFYDIYQAVPFRIAYSHAFTRDRLPLDAGSELELALGVRAGSLVKDWKSWRIRKNGAGVISGVLPPGSYGVGLGSTAWSGVVRPKVRRFEGAVMSGAFFSIGELSPAAIGWQKSLTAFSNSAVLLRVEADQARSVIEDEKAFLKLVKKDLPRSFSREFKVSGGSGNFTITPKKASAARLQRFKTASSGAVDSYKGLKKTHQIFVKLAKDSVQAGHLPDVSLPYLDWRTPELPASIDRNLKRVTSVGNEDRYSAAEVKLVKERYSAAREALASQLPSLRKRAAQVQGRHDFVIEQIGLSAEELIRQLHADTRLTEREKELLQEALELSGWTWVR